MHAAQRKTGAHRKNDVAEPGENLPVQPEGFTNNTFYPIATHGIAHLARDTDSQSAVGLVAAQVNKNKTVTAQSYAVSVHSVELPGVFKKAGLRQGEPLHADQAERRLRPLARRLLMTA